MDELKQGSGGLFGRIAVAKGLVREADLARALRQQEDLRAFGINRPLGAILVEQGLMAREDVERVIKLQRVNQRMQDARSYAAVVLKNALATEAQLEQALELARTSRFKRPLEEILVEQGVLPLAIAQAVTKALQQAAARRAGQEAKPAGSGSGPRAAVEPGGGGPAIALDAADLASAGEPDTREEDMLFAAVALRDGLVLLTELETALREQRLREQPGLTLEQVLRELGTLAPHHVEAVHRGIELAREERLTIPGYRIEGVLGQGATSLVLRGRHELIGREVAIKVLREDLAEGSPEESASEAQAIAGIRHPHVVALYEAGRIQRRIYYVMELVDGPTLMERIERGPLPEREALERIREVAAALGAVEAAGLVHGDVKPHNILLSSQGAKLTDLGLAREAGAPPRDPDKITGSPYTMSPEQAEAKPLTIQSDLYSLGATLYFALTGEPPYDDPNPLEIVLAHLTQGVPDPRDVRATVSKAAAHLTTALMAKDPADRPGSPAEVEARIAAILDDLA